MIVRDEEAVIQRALASAKPFINKWLIVDTGSTDRTKEIICREMADLSGTLVERPWVNFGHNRSEALALCEGEMDWAIMLDADDNLNGQPPPAGFWDSLPTEIDGIALNIKHSTLWHRRVQIFRMGRGWMYKGVLHEYPVCGERSASEARIGVLPQETFMETRCEGFRSRNPQKYLDDARVLEVEHAANPQDGRTLFYLAQSYRDAGLAEEAARGYAKYLDMGATAGSVQERYIAMINLLMLAAAPAVKLELAWRAIDLCPTRLEAPFLILQKWREAGWQVTAQVWALATAVKNRRPDMSWLFVNRSVYEWGMDNEIAIAAFARGCYRECYEASARCAVLAPEESMRDAARKNALAAEAKL